MIKLLKTNKITIALILFIISISFLLVFSIYTSPLYKGLCGYDSDFFQMVGFAMTKGYVPYRDFFDMKGPYLFFIEYISQSLCTGKFGCFIIQIISLFITFELVLMIYKIPNSKINIVKEVILLIPFLFVFSYTIDGGNLTEEYSLPFIFLSIYLFYKNFYKINGDEHKNSYALIYGICLGVLSFIRITNAISICAIVVTVLIILIKNKKYMNILTNTLFFVLGIIITFIPVFIYFNHYHQLGNMFYCVFVFGFKYAVNKEPDSINIICNLLALIPIMCIIISKCRDYKIWLLNGLNSIFTLAILFLGNAYLHYYMLYIPSIVIGIFTLIQNKSKLNFKTKLSKIALALIIIIFIVNCKYLLINTTKFVNSFISRNSGISISSVSDFEYTVDIKNHIPKEDANQIYGYNIHSNLYTISNSIPCNKYCDWQEHYIELDPSIEDQIDDMFETSPPKMVVIGSNRPMENEKIINRLSEKYEMIYSNDEYKLYKIKN